MSLVRGQVAPAGDSPGVGLTLDAVDRNQRVRVLRVSGGTRLVHRLAALGVVPGAVLVVVKPQGPSIVSLGGARIAIGKGAETSVDVEVVQE